MPIDQLKRKRSGDEPTGFSTHRFGSAPRPSNTPSVRPRTPNAMRPRRIASERDVWIRDLARTGSGEREKRDRSRRFSQAAQRGLLRFGIGAVIIGFIGTFFAFAYYSKDLPDPNKIIERDIAQSTKIYDRTGITLLYEIHGTERRTLIELSDIPQYAIDAAISIEDKNFYKHKGLSLPHIAKAILLEALQKIGLYRGLVPGGSTLTQQFIKNAVLTTEKSYSRKIKEFVLAYRMERKFSKEEILKLYFNEIPYGSTAYGIEAASHIYFDKNAKDLTLAEAAVLAALPQAPSYYSPYGSHKDELLGRAQYVLKLMKEQSYITEDQEREARSQEVAFKKRREDIKAPHFVFMVKEQLSLRYGERLIEQGGLKIITTLDIDKQAAAEEAIAQFEKQNAEKYNANNASLVSIDVKTGEVVALVGSKDYFNDDIDGQVNVAISPRQPGSSLKPLIYAEAFNRGYRPESMVFDLVTSFAAAGTPYQPHNYDSKEHGPVSFRAALQGSLNIPAVKVLYLIGVNRAVELAQELGYTTLTDPDRYGLSLVLGGGEVKLIDHANAYAAYAREGVAKSYVSVLKVEGADGTVLEEHKNSGEKRVLPREVARTLSNVLSDNAARAYIFGEKNYLTLSGRPVAAKTGTTNNYHDAWTLGYTPSLAAGVWVGNSDNSEMKRGADGSIIAAPIWNTYMNTVLAGTPVEGFKNPESVPPCSKPMLCGAVGSERTVNINGDNGKLASPYTPLSKIKKVSYRELHDILHYVNKNDPTGPVPENPADDPQYRLWEEQVARWAKDQGIITDTPPTEIDDAYRPEDQPSVTILSPVENSVITVSPATFNATAAGPHGIARVTFLLNDTPIGSATQAPYSVSFTATPVTPNGTYTLTAIAADAFGNEKAVSIPIILDVPRSGADWLVTWVTPAPNATYSLVTVPDTLRVNIRNPHLLKKIDFYSEHGGSTSFIGYQNVSGATELTQTWTKPVLPGEYQLSLVVTDSYDITHTLPKINITVTE